MKSDSLGGKNTANRHGGVRSSRARSALFQKLKKLDRKIHWFDFWISYGYPHPGFSFEKSKIQRNKLDQKRKETRNLIKYGAPKLQDLG